MALFIEGVEVTNNRIIINGVKGAPKDYVLGYITAPLSFNSTADFGAIGQQSYENVLTQFSASVTSILNRFMKGKRRIDYIRGIQNTVLTWSGTENFAFDIQMLFVATKETDDIRKPVTDMMVACVPDFNEEELVTFLVKAPNDYSATNLKDAFGVVSVNIGTWFRSGKKFVITSVSPTFSKEVIASSGLPIYAEMGVRFQSFRVLSPREIRGMFTARRGTA
jgi:hypothetical protein